MVVAVQAAMETREPTQVGGGGICGDRTFLEPGDGRGVVGHGGNGQFTHVEALGGHIGLRQNACLLEVTIGDGAFWVRVAD